MLSKRIIVALAVVGLAGKSRVSAMITTPNLVGTETNDHLHYSHRSVRLS